MGLAVYAREILNELMIAFRKTRVPRGQPRTAANIAAQWGPAQIRAVQQIIDHGDVFRKQLNSLCHPSDVSPLDIHGAFSMLNNLTDGSKKIHYAMSRMWTILDHAENREWASFLEDAEGPSPQEQLPPLPRNPVNFLFKIFRK